LLTPPFIRCADFENRCETLAGENREIGIYFMGIPLIPSFSERFVYE
jgi:hypothetical protein